MVQLKHTRLQRKPKKQTTKKKPPKENKNQKTTKPKQNKKTPLKNVLATKKK